MDRDLLDRLAAVAHDLWRRKMEREGWRHAPAFNCKDHRHDALQPYERLDPFDRRQVRIGVECLDLERTLLEGVEHDRSASREFRPEEMRAGRAVELTGPFGEGPVEGRGVIESWEVGTEGELTVIRVRFSDGELAEYAPSQRELRRPEESGSSS